jgi:hypothetical protein
MISNTMKLDIMNPHVMRIIIAARPEDSISAISKRIGLSYGWTYKWALELEKAEVFKRSGKKLILNEKAQFYRQVLRFLNITLGKDVDFHYRVLPLFGVKYCFTSTDAVFFWTDGGYNIARYHSHYPIFIKVKSSDRETFEFYMKKLELIGKKEGVYFEPSFLDDFNVSTHEGVPVDSLDETITFMKKYFYNFEPALEMVQEMYGRKLGVKYKEAVLNV